MHKELVEERPWLTERQFLNALSFCMLLPGPEAMQLATYAGWRIAGVRGGLIAGAALRHPRCAGDPGARLDPTRPMAGVPLVQALFLGIKGRGDRDRRAGAGEGLEKGLTGALPYGLAAAAFLGLYALQVPFPLIVLGAGLIGALFMANAPPEAAPPPVSARGTARTVALWSAIWLVPLAALWAVAPGGLLADDGLFSPSSPWSPSAAPMRYWPTWCREVVADHGWLTTAQIDGRAGARGNHARVP